jgi:uncharacterized protein YkwD
MTAHRRRGALRAGIALALSWPLGAAADFHSDVVHLLVQRTNELRAQSGWKPLATEPRLTVAAARFARYMAETDRYGHEVDGRQPTERAQAQGYDHCLTAENIAFASSTRGSSQRRAAPELTHPPRGDGGASPPPRGSMQADELAQRLFDGWVHSPPHRRNLLDGDMTHVGMAVAQSARSGKHYAVQLFGRPRALVVRITLANRSRDTVQYELAGESYELRPDIVRTHERCRRALLALKAEGLDETSAAKPIAIEHGARYRVEDSGTGIRLRRE